MLKILYVLSKKTRPTGVTQNGLRSWSGLMTTPLKSTTGPVGKKIIGCSRKSANCAASVSTAGASSTGLPAFRLPLVPPLPPPPSAADIFFWR